jgi:hypothetical protein
MIVEIPVISLGFVGRTRIQEERTNHPRNSNQNQGLPDPIQKTRLGGEKGGNPPLSFLTCPHQIDLISFFLR